MKKLKTLLILSGLATSLLAGCKTNTKSSEAPASSDAPVSSVSNPESISSVAPSSEPASSSQLVETVASIAVVTEPTKKSYRTGEEFDAAGLVVKAVYNTGRETNLNANDYQLSGFDSESAGLKEITVTYEGKTTSFNVSVFGKNGLEIVSAPDKVIYAVGDEFDATGLEVALKWSDGSSDPLAEGEFTVAGFDSVTPGEKIITVTAGSETATFTVDVYAKDWSSADKTLMNQYLLYSFPYYLSFSIEEGGLVNPNTEEEICTWYEARTAFEAGEAALNEYKATLEAIKVSGQQAWNPFESTGFSGSRYTDDLDYLGFDEESEVYQYMRMYNDNEEASGYQVLSMGLDPEGKLLIVTTVALLPAGGWADGGGFYGAGTTSSGQPFDMVEELLDLVDGRAQLGYEDAENYGIGFTDFFEVPEHSHDTVVFFLSMGHDSPYTLTNLYSNVYDGGSFYMSFTNEYATAGTPNFTQEDFDALLARYEARGVEFVLDDVNYSIPIYTLETVYNGYELSILFYFSENSITYEVKVKGFELPYTANVFLSLFETKMEAYAENQSLDCERVEGVYNYDPENNVAMDGYLLGYADTDAGFINGVTMANRNLVKGTLRQTGLLTAAEINALNWTTMATANVGTAKVNDEANVQYSLAADGNTLQFVSGDKLYSATYNPEDGKLTVVISVIEGDDADVTVVFNADEFTAATGSNNDAFAGTWENADLKLTLSKSKEVIMQQRIQFTAAAQEDGSAMQYTVILQATYVPALGRYVVMCVIYVRLVNTLQQ